MDRRKHNNDSFRPALRFPTDPSNPNVLPSKIQHIVGSGSAGSGAASPSSSSPGSSAVNLLQSKRKPWEVDVTRLDDLVARSSRSSKVVVILGDPPSACLEPIVTSDYLRGGLVIIVASADSNLTISAQTCVPAVRILRLRASTSSSAPTRRPSSHAHATLAELPTAAPEQAQLTAARLNIVLDWANRIAFSWRQGHQQAHFALLCEEDDNPTGGPKSGTWKWKNRSRSQIGAENDGEGRLAPWTARFALNSRSNTSSLADTSSSSSLFLVDGRPASSASLNHVSTNQPLPRRSTASSALGHSALRMSSAPPSTRPAPKRRFSILSIVKSSPDVSALPSTSAKSDKPAFDAVINFLPPSSATGAEGSLGRGAIATTHAAAAHSRLLLRQTILVTTATQRFLVPLPPRTSSSPSVSASYAEGSRLGSGRFGSLQSGGRPLVPRVGSPNAKSKRWSLSFVGAFFGAEPVVSAKSLGKRSVLPTPPISRPSSSDEPGPPSSYRRPATAGDRTRSTSISMAGSFEGHGMPPKLVHVLPFSAATSTNNNATAKLVRSLEAFLLSWSFGGGRDQGAGGIPEEGQAVAATGKKTIRPFLLDASGLADVLKATDPLDNMLMKEWSLTDLILSGAMDDEYPCSGQSPMLTPPEVIVTRASSDRPPQQRPSTAPSRYGEGSSRPSSYTDNAESEPSGSSEPWAVRRAWLGGVMDLVVHPSSARSGQEYRPRIRSMYGGSGLLPKERSQQTPPPPLPRMNSHTRSLSESSTTVPRTMEESRSNMAPSSFADHRLQKALPRQPSYSDDGHSIASSRKLQKTPSLKRSSPELSRRAPHVEVPRRPSQQEMSSAYSTPIAQAFSSSPVQVYQEGSPWATPSPPTAWNVAALPSHEQRRPPFPQDEDYDTQFGARGQRPQMGQQSSSAAGWEFVPRPAGPERTDTVGTMTTVDTMLSYSTVGSYAPDANAQSQSSFSARSAPPPLPTPTSPYNGMSVPRPMPRPPQAVSDPQQVEEKRSSRGFTVPQPTSASDRRRRSTDGDGYFNGYLVASPPPPRPQRMRPPPPPPSASPAATRSGSSPLRHGVSADPIQHRLAAYNGSVRDKNLPITPPDSASSSEVSNEVESSGSGTSSSREKRKWWAGPTKVALKMM